MGVTRVVGVWGQVSKDSPMTYVGHSREGEFAVGTHETLAPVCYGLVASHVSLSSIKFTAFVALM